MNFIRKFYDAGVVEAGGGAEAAVAEDLSPAASLAKFGQKSDENRVTPVIIPEKKAEPKVGEEKPAATAEETKATEKPAETPQGKSIEEPKKAEIVPIVQEPAKVQTLDEVLKTNQPDTIFKALGYDEQMAKIVGELKDADPKLIGIVQAYKEGTLGNYIKELSTDYSKMDAEDVMRHQLRVDYPKATPKQLEILYKREIVDAYNLDSGDDNEVAEGKELLAAKADRYRDSFIDNQNKYLLPSKPEPKAAPASDNTAEVQAQQRVEAYKNGLLEDPFTKDIIANKKITLGEGEEKFSYPVEANALIDILTDGKKWAETMWDTETEKPKIEHQLAVAAFALDSKKFLNEYAKHLKAVGAKEVIEPIDNASKPENSTPAKSEVEPKTPAANLAKHGVRSNGSN